jgi:hypothetical protein
MLYTIEFSETHIKTVEIEATTQEEALEKFGNGEWGDDSAVLDEVYLDDYRAIIGENTK